MSLKIASASFLAHYFQEFFNLFLRQKEQALRSQEVNGPLSPEEESKPATEMPLVNLIQRRLSLLLEEQSLQSTSQAGGICRQPLPGGTLCHGCLC